MASEADETGYDKNNEKVQANGAWITKDFLQEVISKHEKNDEVRVIDSNVSAAVGVGDNYLSILYRTKIELVRKDGGPVEKLQLMIKGAPTSKFLLDMMEEMGIFKKELAMYNECLPFMKELLKEYMPEEKYFIAAESYECSTPNTIVMEDLQISGYKMADRRKQLDFEHCAAILKSLARFHALSVRVVEKKPELIKKVSDDFYHESKREQMEPYLDRSFPVWAEVLEETENCSRFVPYIRKNSKYSFDKMLEIVKPTANSISVLCHGDSWINNFLFKYDENGKVLHAKLVDFQLSRYGSPTTDLLYFLFSSPRPEVLTERFFDLIKVYHEAFTSDLRRLKIDCKKFTLEQIHEELKERSFFPIVVLASITPIILAKPADAVNMDDFDPEKIESMNLRNNYKDPLYLGVFEKFFGFLEKEGFLKEAEERTRLIEEIAAAKAAERAKKIENQTDLKFSSQPTEITANSS